MTYTPTASQLTRLRRRIGDSIPSGGNDSDTAFTDAELSDIWDEALGDMDTATLYALQSLLSDAARLSDYTAGQTSEKRSQVFENLRKMVEYWEGEVQSGNQVLIVGTRATPPVYKQLPYGEEHPDEKNRRHNDDLMRRRRGRYGY